jgi:mxaA protein
MIQKAAIVLSALLASRATAQIRSVDLHPPARDFGYFAGDLLTATATIVTGRDTVLDQRTLPAPGPVSAAIDICKADVTETLSADGRVTAIRIVYQNFFAPQNVLHADIPGYTVAFSQGTRRLTALVPGFAIAVSPFRHDLQPVLDPAILRPDHPPAPPDSARPRQQLAAGLGLTLAGLLLLGLPRFRHGLLSRTQPFAGAARHLARARRRVDEAARREALLVLHRAFDATFGQRVFAEDVDRFLQVRPRFLPLRQQIGAFFAASQAAFFAPDPVLPSLPDLARLSRELARAERSS